MAIETQLEDRVARSHAVGLVLYAATLVGEGISAYVRGFLVGAVVVIALLVTGHARQPQAIPFGIIAGALPLASSFLALFYPGSGVWWKTRSGARELSTREREAYERALAPLIASDPSARPPRHVYALDEPELNAAVSGEALMINRGLLESQWLTAVLAHELGHLNSLDGRLTAALSRLVLRRSQPRPRDHPSGCLAVVARLVLSLAGGGSGLLLTSPFWGAYWREREYLADAYAKKLGAGEQLAERSRPTCCSTTGRCRSRG
jgi:Zn-dependent protease with chaperone function